MDESVENCVHVRIGFNIIQANEARIVRRLGQVESWRERMIYSLQESWSKCWIEEIFYVVERWISDFVSIR